MLSSSHFTRLWRLSVGPLARQRNVTSSPDSASCMPGLTSTFGVLITSKMKARKKEEIEYRIAMAMEIAPSSGVSPWPMGDHRGTVCGTLFFWGGGGGCSQMGNAVKDQCHSERRSVEPRIMWVVAAWVGAHLSCALQRVTLLYRRTRKVALNMVQPPGNTPCCTVWYTRHGEAVTSGRQSVLVLPPEFFKIHCYKV